MAETELETKPVVTKRPYKRRGPSRPKGRRKAKSVVPKGLIDNVVAKPVKVALHAERAKIKALVRALVAKEVKRAVMAAFR